MTTIDWAKLAGALDGTTAGASIDTNVSMSHDEMTLSATYSFQQSAAPATWQVAANGEGLTIAYSHESSDDARDMMHIRSENGTFNYAMSGTVSGDITGLTLSLTVLAQLSIGMTSAPDEEANVVDMRLTIPYAIALLPNGPYQVTPGTVTPFNESQQVDFGPFVQGGMQLTDQSEGLQFRVGQIFAACGNLAEVIETVLNPRPA